jgi:signal transduction histidine kinase
LLNLRRYAPRLPSGRGSASAPRTQDGQAEVIVADDGPGVAPENRDRIFLRFVTTRPGGNGLGLSTSREIAQAHGGTLLLRDGPPGATFVLTLPPA